MKTNKKCSVYVQGPVRGDLKACRMGREPTLPNTRPSTKKTKTLILFSKHSDRHLPENHRHTVNGSTVRQR